MIKNWLAATGWAVLYWVLIFILITVVMFGLPQINQMWQKAIGLILELLALIFCAGMYFKKYSGNFLDGVILGIWFLIIGTILDWAITITLFVKSAGTFYGTWSIWTGFIMTILFSGIVAEMFKKKI